MKHSALKKIALIDSYAFFYRAHYAFEKNPLLNSKGENTSVIFSFISSLLQIAQEHEPQNIICILDSKGKSFRHEIDQNYKANRPPMPEDLKKQIKILTELIPLLGLPCWKKVGYEADDIIAQTARNFRGQKDTEILIYSSDKDLMQLIGDNVFAMVGDRQNRLWTKMDEEKVLEKYGIPPKKMADYLALVGDASDNVAGVRGVGKVSACKLLQNHKSMESIYQNIENIKGSLKEKLEKGYEAALLSKKLVTLDHTIANVEDWQNIDLSPIQQEKVSEILNYYECHALIKKIARRKFFLDKPKNDDETINKQQNTINPFHFARKEIKNNNDITEMIHFLQQRKKFIFDLETTSLDAFSAKIVTISFATIDEKNGEKKSFFINFLESKIDFLQLTKLHELFENENIGKIGHNLKYEYGVLKNHFIKLRGLWHDTMIYEYLLNAGYSRLKLEDLATAYLDYQAINYDELTKEEPDITLLDSEKLKEYSLQDSEMTALIYNEQREMAQTDIFRKIEMPLITVLAEIELNGVCIDINYLKQLEEEYKKRLDESEKNIFGLAGEKFNIGSTKQLKEILFDKLDIAPLKKKKTGYSTDHSVLEKLAKTHPIAVELLTYRKYDKLLNTYVKTLPTLVHHKTKRIHTSYNQAITATGRLSSNKPNLQNIPVKMEDGQGLRRAFVAPKGMEEIKFVSIDYSQVELRILAYLSEDKTLCEAYRQDKDIHKKTASLLFGKEEEEIKDEERNIAKTINFSILYGTSAHSLANALSISYEDAKRFIEAYRRSYPGVIEYMEKKLEQARENGYVSTYFGRKRSVKGIVSENFQIRSRDERIAFNTIIQGTASDIIKMAMIKINESIDHLQWPCKMVMQVHDELVFYIPTAQIENIVPKLIAKMIKVPPFHQILKVQATIGDYWKK